MRLVRLSDALASWLIEPHITVRLASDSEIEALRQENQALVLELSRMKTSYADMCNLQLRYADLLRENGIPFR